MYANYHTLSNRKAKLLTNYPSTTSNKAEIMPATVNDQGETMTDQPLIRADGLSFTYSLSADAPQIPLFERFSFTLAPGERVAVAGRSGSGKSTFLRLLSRLIEPTGGQLYFRERPYGEYFAPDLRRQVALVPQTPVIFDGDGRTNLTFHLDRKPDDATLRGWLDRFDLPTDLLDRSALKLSVGQKSRLTVIRSLLMSPAVLLLDEPTAGLDRATENVVVEVLREESARRNMGIVVNAHHLDLIGPAVDRVVDLTPATEAP